MKTAFAVITLAAMSLSSSAFAGEHAGFKLIGTAKEAKAAILEAYPAIKSKDLTPIHRMADLSGYYREGTMTNVFDTALKFNVDPAPLGQSTHIGVSVYKGNDGKIVYNVSHPMAE